MIHDENFKIVLVGIKHFVTFFFIHIYKIENAKIEKA